MPAKIAIIYYSMQVPRWQIRMYNHILTLAEGIKEGVKEAGIDADIFQLPETLPAEVLTLMHAPPKSTKYPVLHDPNKLKEYDGFLLGAPTRYGRVPAQVSAFFDMTGGLWASGALVGKYAGIFSSTASQHGGQETTALTTIPFFAHHGIAFVPLGYAEPTGVLNKVDKVVGGSPWGATTIAGSDGSRQVAEEELTVARFQGKSFATLLSTVVRGRELQVLLSAETSRF
ncbi:benzoquinone reductase [Atractiella rhizophila]|nr:benzoquinone reductase [Atractiella rhizophila]